MSDSLKAPQGPVPRPAPGTCCGAGRRHETLRCGVIPSPSLPCWYFLQHWPARQLGPPGRARAGSPCAALTRWRPAQRGQWDRKRAAQVCQRVV